MGDSDDEYDRRERRNKFRGERNDYQDRNTRNRREDWTEGRDVGWRNQNREQTQQRRDYRDNYGGGQRRERYSPADMTDRSPPVKRQRQNTRDNWDDRGYPNYDMPYGPGNWNAGDNSAGGHHRNDNQRDGDFSYTQPAMQTFKQFLLKLEDNVGDQEAIKKYNEYKSKFRRERVEEFFKAHQNEEWFRSKYYPKEMEKRKAEQEASLKRRLDVFMDLFNSGWIDSVSIDVEKAKDIIRLLDAAVIKLEGGTDFDLKALDEDYEEEKSKEPDLSLFSVEVQEKPKEKQWTNENENENENEDIKQENGEESLDGIKKEERENANEEDYKRESGNDSLEKIKVESFDESSDQTKQTSENIDSMEEGEASMDASTEQPSSEQLQEEIKREIVKETPEKPNKEISNKPRSLHKTVSVFLRNLPPTESKEEIEELCKRHEGFLRLCLADPQPERKFFRRGWATYERHVNIREICWALNSIERKYELGAIVNRDLSRRIRSVNGIASDKNIVRADIRHAAKIVFNLDKQKKLWQDESGEQTNDSDTKKPLFGFPSKNPLLNNITDYLIEEASAEEEELLGTSNIEYGEGANGSSLDRDETIIKVLDRLILYLRIVHSVDYYNHSVYPNEDEMPNRIGIMHARGMVSTSSINQQEIDDYIKQFETKIEPFLQPSPVVTEEDAIVLGLKDPEVEAESFVEANITKMGDEKWLCPLSGKKFKGPDFVRKHILNKHAEKIEEAKQMAEFYNNYIRDPKRPQLPEHPLNRVNTNTSNRNDQHQNSGPSMYMHGPMPGPYGGPPPPPPGSWSMGYGPRPPMAGFGPPVGGYRYQGPHGPNDGSYGRGQGGRRYQRVKTYRDLDAPEEQEIE